MCRGPLSRPMDAGAFAYFETWLNRKYRRPDDDPAGERDSHEDGNLVGSDKHLLAFPVVLTSRGELAGLLRCDLGLRFIDDSRQPYYPSNPVARAQGRFPPLPGAMELKRAVDRENIQLPFHIDTRLLRESLGVAPEDANVLLDTLATEFNEHIDGSDADDIDAVALYKSLGQSTLNGLSALLDPSDGAPASKVTIDTLVTLVNQRLEAQGVRSRGTKAYPFGFVMDATQARATWHLQRELEDLSNGGIDKKTVTPPLKRYLGAKVSAPDQGTNSVMKGAVPGRPLTTNQRSIGELALGTPFLPVQGPPGTGKTTLILHLCASAVVEQVEAYLQRKDLDDALVLVASTNNRAVDNVVMPLDTMSAGPLALRTGSREACAQTSAGQIRGTLGWLGQLERENKGVPQAELNNRLRATVDIFTACLKNLGGLQKGKVNRFRLEAEMAEARRVLDNLGRPPKTTNKTTSPTAKPRKLDDSSPATDIQPADLALAERAITSLESLGALALQKPTAAGLRRLERAYAQISKTWLPLHTELRNKFSHPDGQKKGTQHGDKTNTWPLPPTDDALDDASLEDLFEAWEAGIDTAVALAESLHEGLDVRLADAAIAEKRQAAQQRLAKAEAALGALGPPGGHTENDTDSLRVHDAQVACFQAALQVREAWAVCNLADLQRAMKVALNKAQSEKSLRTLFRSEASAGKRLRQLFPIWGSTLLSVPNAVPVGSRKVKRW